MELNERIKLLRKSLGLSQPDFGRHLGVSRSVVNNLERGVLVNSNSVIPLVKLMAKEFSVSEDWLMYGSTSRPEMVPECGTDSRAFLKSCGISQREIDLICMYMASERDARRAFSSCTKYISAILNFMAGGIVFEDSDACE